MELRTNVWTNRRTDGWTDNPITRCPGGPFRPLKTIGRMTVRREIWLLCNNRNRYRSVCSLLCLSLISYSQCCCVHPTYILKSAIFKVYVTGMLSKVRRLVNLIYSDQIHTKKNVSHNMWVTDHLPTGQ